MQIERRKQDTIFYRVYCALFSKKIMKNIACGINFEGTLKSHGFKSFSAIKIIVKLGCALSTRKNTVIRKNHVAKIYNAFTDKLVVGGCGSVGRVVASESRRLWFESNHWQQLY